MSKTFPPDLLLKVQSPRATRHLLTRAGLSLASEPLRDASAVLVQASAGFGKTSLLAQWRLEQVARGAAVAWISDPGSLDPDRFAQTLILSVRVGAGRPRFGEALLKEPMTPTDCVTGWLAEVAQIALDLVLVLDEVDRLSAESQRLLVYLLRNQPPNLKILLAARSPCELGIEDLLSYGRVQRISGRQLKFSIVETLELARKRPGLSIDDDGAARLHAICEGWPLGLQLLLTAIASGAMPGEGEVHELDGGVDVERLAEDFLDRLFRQLSAADLRLLERIAIADPLHPDLCVLLSGATDANERLKRLAHETPLISFSERGDWLRLHSLARERLCERLLERPQQERERLHGLAADWLSAQGLLEDAARHAWAAGQHERALALAEQNLDDGVTLNGSHLLLHEWLERMPEASLDRYPRLQLAAAWTLTLRGQHVAAIDRVQRLLARPDINEALRYECTLIMGGAAVYADQPDSFAALHDAVDEVPAVESWQLVHENRSAWRQLLQGEPGQARLLMRQRSVGGRRLAYRDQWAFIIQALCNLYEGQVRQVEQQLPSALQRAERELGRRSEFASMLAALLAAALWERGQTADVAALLAHRMDVLERSAMPQAVVMAFCTAARMATAQGAEHRALELLAALDAVGQARKLPRLRVVSLVEQLRLHARRYRAETCRSLVAELDRLLADPALPNMEAAPLWRFGVELSARLARGLALMAAQDWRGASAALEGLVNEARRRRLGRLHIESQALHAYAMNRLGEPNADLLIREAIDLAEALGLGRVFADAHPDLDAWVRELKSAAPTDKPESERMPMVSNMAPTMSLTPKERSVLDLLERSLTNKEIALALQVGEETIKWHVKNLLAKLDASTRRQAVARARTLGLLAAA